jgi:hypothetical protein
LLVSADLLVWRLGTLAWNWTLALLWQIEDLLTGVA